MPAQHHPLCVAPHAVSAPVEQLVLVAYEAAAPGELDELVVRVEPQEYLLPAARGDLSAQLPEKVDVA